MTEASFFVSCTTLQPPLQGFRPPVRPPTENLVAGKAMWSNGHGKMWGHRESILDRTLRQRMRARVTTAPPGRSQDHLVGRPPTRVEWRALQAGENHQQKFWKLVWWHQQEESQTIMIQAMAPTNRPHAQPWSPPSPNRVTSASEKWAWWTSDESATSTCMTF